MSDLRKAAEQALKQLQRDDVYLGHRSKTRADAITALRQALTAPYAKLDTSDRVLHKEWVDLTVEEIIDVIHPLVMADMPDEATDYEIARAIEAKLRSKNT